MPHAVVSSSVAIACCRLQHPPRRERLPTKDKYCIAYILKCRCNDLHETQVWFPCERLHLVLIRICLVIKSSLIFELIVGSE